MMCIDTYAAEYMLKEIIKNATNFVKRAYVRYFDTIKGDQDKTWAPNLVCEI